MTSLELYSVMNEIRDNMLAIGIQCSKYINEIKFTGQRRTWGRCYKNNYSNTYKITISDVLGKKGVDPNALKSVVAHELLHTNLEHWDLDMKR
jgi:predicted metal-dependent hydrolase